MTSTSANQFEENIMEKEYDSSSEGYEGDGPSMEEMDYIGRYLWDKVGSKPLLGKVRRKPQSTVVSLRSEDGLTESVVGVYTLVGNMAFFTDIHSMMSMPRCGFGPGIPNMVHASVPLHVTGDIQVEIAAKQGMTPATVTKRQSEAMVGVDMMAAQPPPTPSPTQFASSTAPPFPTCPETAVVATVKKSATRKRKVNLNLNLTPTPSATPEPSKKRFKMVAASKLIEDQVGGWDADDERDVGPQESQRYQDTIDAVAADIADTITTPP